MCVHVCGWVVCFLRGVTSLEEFVFWDQRLFVFYTNICSSSACLRKRTLTPCCNLCLSCASNFVPNWEDFFFVDLVHFYVWKTELFFIDAVWWAEGSSCCWEDPECCFLGCKWSKPCKQIITAIFCVCDYLVGYWNLIISLVHSFSKQLEKVNNQIAEAEAALEARKKPPEENGPKIVGEGLVIDEWVLPLGWHEIFWFHLVPCILFSAKSHCSMCSLQKERRERYLAQQQVEVVDSV